MNASSLNHGTTLLQVEHLDIHFRHARQHAVKDLSFSLVQGETLAIVGESGCGKSTTALALLGLLGPEADVSGRILLAGRDIVSLPPATVRSLRGREISMIFQEPMTSLNPVHSIGAQIAEVLRLHQGLTAAQARQRVIELLELVRITEPQRRVDDFPHHLSGGQRQRVMIAMAVACQPRLLIADEPTTALDVTVQAHILELLHQLRRELSMGLVLITHDLAVVSQWADRVLVMLDGRSVEQGPVRQLFRQPSHAYTAGLLGASLHSDQERHYTHARLAEIRHTVDRSGTHRGVELVTPTLPTPRADSATQAVRAPLLSVQALRTSYQKRDGSIFHAVDDVSFSINAGQTIGLVGESGCGKSSLSRTLLRLVAPAAGRIEFDGVDLAALSEKQMSPWRRRMQMVFQDPYASLNPRRKVVDILDAVLALHGVTDKRERGQRIATMIDRVGLARSALQRYPHEFSGGQRQRIGIARALVLRPSLLVLDEPVSALDVSIQAQILNLLSELKEEFGLTYLFISHDLSVVRYIADHILVMKNGKIVESGDHRQIWQSPRHAYTQTLLAASPALHLQQ
ncbi:ABC transporter ATP-binding protein [Herbaspirillum sp. alder98]|uniref:ABC transporter ATP-binding protein n=1 Tax=Herbaspirillum sp. alder98 TaxID=2913096 RepID=UPI001CD8EB26|nr:ABC transporter ATP-binding protein [Herbaspirillum sp. alder98]MCA1326091.1 ABC transporter ATP-binding protein [Herbaspirillum sp. alder98]